MNYQHPDLTLHPPRSPHVRLGGFAHLPRLIDKARATAAGANGEYHYDCLMDANFWAFTGLKAGAFLAEVKAGKIDHELLAYVMAHLSPARTPSEIASWSIWLTGAGPGSLGMREFLHSLHQSIAPAREDLVTLMDFLDLDDYVSFGGKA